MELQTYYYKGFDSNLTCTHLGNTIQYEVGKEYETPYHSSSTELPRLKSLINIDMIDELIKEGEAHLKYYEEVKESMLADNDIPIRIKEIYIGLSEALRPTLDLLYKEREKYESK